MINIIALMDKYKIEPRRSAGQNFLINEEILERIIEVAQLKKTDFVLEVGPGLGVLTAELIKHAKRVVAVELDRTLMYVLKQEFRTANNLELVNDDILKLRPEGVSKKLDGKPYKIVANIPYNITSKFIRVFLESEFRPEEMVIMIQKEVGERIASSEGSRLSIATQFYATPSIEQFVGSECFEPRPAVDSVILKLKVKKELPDVDQKKFFQLLRIGFSAKRKQLQNNLKNGLRRSREDIVAWLKACDLDPEVRAEDLSLEDWVRLVNNDK